MQSYFGAIEQEWTELVSSIDSHILELSSQIAQQHAAEMSQTFYRILLVDSQAEEFLSNEQVEKQLKKSLEMWLKDVLSCTPDSVKRLVAFQQHIGEKHARIGIPVPLVDMGSRILKKQLFPFILALDCNTDDKFQLFHFTTASIDLAIEIIAKTFSFNESNTSREDENYRVFSLLENAEEEKERQISNILSWEMDVVYKVILEAEFGNVQTFSRSDFGLWFNHKGRHYFSGMAGVGYISKLILELDDLALTIRNTTHDSTNKSKQTEYLVQIRDSLSQISTLLKELFDEVARNEVGMDVLTRLLNRRFLPTIFKREIAHASRANTPLSVLIIDIDLFKHINDTYGHIVGDEVLRKVSQAFYDSVRSSDYVFRYGGDEFLIILAETAEQDTVQVAERIRNRVAKQLITAQDGNTFSVTLSIGAAMFRGHPDYEHLIRSADEALYRAKSLGRNRVEMWKPAS